MTLEQAVKDNPYDPEKGDLSAYGRYLRYNVSGWYNKSNKYVRDQYQQYLVKITLPLIEGGNKL